MGGFNGGFLRSHGGFAVRNHTVIQIIPILAAGFRRDQNCERGSICAAEFAEAHFVVQFCYPTLIIFVPLIGIASRAALDGHGECYRIMLNPEQSVGGILLIGAFYAGDAAGVLGLSGNIQLVAHAVAADGADAVAVIAVSGQIGAVGCPQFLVFVLVAQAALPPVRVFIMAPAVAGERIMFVKVGAVGVFFIQMLLKIGVIAAPDIAAAAVAAQGVGQVFAAVLAAKLTGTCTGVAESHIVEAAAAVDAEVILILVVIFAHLFGALAGQLAAARAADDTGVKAGSAQVALVLEKLPTALTDAVVPIGAGHADLAALAACHHRVEFAALHAQAAVRTGLQMVARNAFAALLARLAAFFTVIILHKHALLGDLVAVAAFRAVHSV